MGLERWLSKISPCSCRGPELDSQNPHWMAHNWVPVPRNSVTPFWPQCTPTYTNTKRNRSLKTTKDQTHISKAFLFEPPLQGKLCTSTSFVAIFTSRCLPPLTDEICLFFLSDVLITSMGLNPDLWFWSHCCLAQIKQLVCQIYLTFRRSRIYCTVPVGLSC